MLVLHCSASIITGDAYVIRNETTPSKWSDNEEIQIFRDYLRIPTVHPNIDYSNVFFEYQIIVF